MASSGDFSDVVRRAVQANARFSRKWMDLSFEYLREISAIVGGAADSVAPTTEADAGTGALVLEGEGGSVVRGSFLVSNDMNKVVSCAFVGSDFRDPRGSSVKSKSTFEPPSLELGPGEQRVVQVSIPIDDALAVGVGYAGEISVRGMDGFSVPVVLRRQHAVEELPVERDHPAGDPANEPGAQRSSRGKRTPTSRSRKNATR